MTEYEMGWLSEGLIACSASPPPKSVRLDVCSDPQVERYGFFLLRTDHVV